MEALSLPSDRFARSGNPAWPEGRTAYFAPFGSWPGVLPKNAESLRNSDALMRVAVPRRRGPAGLRDLFRFCRNRDLYIRRSGLSACARHGRYHYPRRALRAAETPDGRLSKRLICRFLRLPSSTPCAVTFSANIQISLSVISVANAFALWYDKSHKSGLSEMRVSQNNRKGKNAEQMLHDANDAKELSDDWDQAKDLCYDYNQLRPSKELFAL